MKRTLSEDAWLTSIGKHRGVAIRILDVFEEMLESKGLCEIIEGKMTNKKLKEYEGYVASAAEQSSTTERQAEEAERDYD